MGGIKVCGTWQLKVDSGNLQVKAWGVMAKTPRVYAVQRTKRLYF